MTNIVYNMDCMDGMKEYPDGYFDLAVVDPPYFSGPERRGYYGSNISAARTERHYYPVTKNGWFRTERISKSCSGLQTAGSFGDAITMILCFPHMEELYGTNAMDQIVFLIVRLLRRTVMKAFGYSGTCGTGCVKGKASKMGVSCRGTERKKKYGYTRRRSQ